MDQLEPAVPAATASASASTDDALGALRSFLTLLVVAHHAVLAYHPFAPPPGRPLDAAPRLWMAFPVVDPARWGGFGWLVGWNDTFFMALMFFISGLFVVRSLRRKGAAVFVRDRALRLGVPFLVAAAILAPIAYLPSYLQAGGAGGFVRAWLGLGEWPAGPAWFIWLLLAFDVLAAALYAAWPVRLRRRGGPAATFALLALASGLAYVPLERLVGGQAWLHVGPFFAQTSRLLHYAVYFFAGVLLGGQEGGPALLARGGRLAARWPRWWVLATAAFGFEVFAFIAAVSGGPPIWETLASIGFVLACASISFAMLALFIRFAGTLAPRLAFMRDRAYGVYLVHYAIVSWLQLGLLGAALPGAVKGALVTVAAVALSWLVVGWLRRVPAIARVV